MEKWVDDKTEENMFVERSSVWGYPVSADKFYCSEKNDQDQWYESSHESLHRAEVPPM